MLARGQLSLAGSPCQFCNPKGHHSDALEHHLLPFLNQQTRLPDCERSSSLDFLSAGSTQLSFVQKIIRNPSCSREGREDAVQAGTTAPGMQEAGAAQTRGVEAHTTRCGQRQLLIPWVWGDKRDTQALVWWHLLKGGSLKGGGSPARVVTSIHTHMWL